MDKQHDTTESHIDRIYAGIGNAGELIDGYNLGDQPGAGEQLGRIAELADGLATALEGLCVKPCGIDAAPEACENGANPKPASDSGAGPAAVTRGNVRAIREPESSNGEALYGIKDDIRDSCERIKQLADTELPGVARLADDIIEAIEPEEPIDRGSFALVVSNSGENVYSMVSGIRGIADALEGPVFDDINCNVAQELVLALSLIARRLYDATYNTPYELDKTVREAIFEKLKPAH